MGRRFSPVAHALRRALRLTILLAATLPLVLTISLLSGCSNPAERPGSQDTSSVPAPAAPPSANPPATNSPVTSPSGAPQTADPKATEPPDTPSESIPEIQGLVDVTLLDSTLVIDLRYATENNFTGQKIYTDAKCLLVRSTAEKLVKANKEFAEMGYRLKIWDAYRPLSAQQTLWDVVPDRTYVADPKKGSIHNRGCAVDVTLVDADGNEFPMPSGFDDFSEKASITYTGCTEEEARNRELLAEVMVRNGFARYSAEWWHFTDIEAGNYPLLDVQFDEFR